MQVCNEGLSVAGQARAANKPNLTRYFRYLVVWVEGEGGEVID